MLHELTVVLKQRSDIVLQIVLIVAAFLIFVAVVLGEARKVRKEQQRISKLNDLRRLQEFHQIEIDKQKRRESR